MSTPLVIHLHSEGFERAYQALTLALTAQAMGQEVAIVLAFGALRALAEDRLGEATPGPDLWCARRAEMQGVSSPAKLLAEARALDRDENERQQGRLIEGGQITDQKDARHFVVVEDTTFTNDYAPS